MSGTEDTLREQPPRNDGRLIVSYPKSGRTWVRYALSQYKIDVSFTHAKMGTRPSEMGLPFKGIPSALSQVPLVFLHRNPIDTAVSMYYQTTRREVPKWSRRWFKMYVPLALRSALPPQKIDDFVLHPLYGVEKTSQFNRAWLDHLSGRTDCLVLSYETLRANPENGFQMLLDFLGETIASGNDLAAISDFEKMKADAERDFQPAIYKPRNPNDPNSAKVRRGKVGGYHDELSPETVAECEKIAERYGFGTAL